MKLKTWLRENKNMSYSEYRALPETDRIDIYTEFERYNRVANNTKNQPTRMGWRPMTDEEQRWADEVGKKERERFLVSIRIGGIDERGNYTALHHRWDEH